MGIMKFFHMFMMFWCFGFMLQALYNISQGKPIFWFAFFVQLILFLCSVLCTQ